MGMRKYVRELSFTIPVAGLAFHNLFLFALTIELGALTRNLENPKYMLASMECFGLSAPVNDLTP